MCTILCVPFGVLSWFKNKKNVPFLYNLPHFKPHNKQKRQPLRTAPVKPGITCYVFIMLDYSFFSVDNK